METPPQEHFPVKDNLHTDILEQKYGPIHAEVLRHDNVHEMEKKTERIREARLVDQQNILRTYALTFLTYDKDRTEIASIDDEIRQGGLIGQTFRNHGYTIKKNVIDVFIIPIPAKMSDDFKVETTEAKARLTEFYAKKTGTPPTIYGTVLEIYSPDFKNPEDGINDVDINQVNPLTGALQDVGVPIDEIWEHLDRASENNEWGDLKEKYEQARQLSQPIVQSLHEKITQYLENSQGEQ
ncbi:MAG: hypothetical protein UV82_C0015G0002 [Candidatus Magasanikbacteria bacterium GW2011_GWD2_43_18]|uniref:Uncharacterized protein n=1 Tax=Candidatus Magasanikbacteria bacterium GW2011_GWE2_42_7 TaxID=1619052 RepID=A0A0G1DJJ8_9BACT|nr:MAG: hypothetical protein UV18_C0004G0002 [Candidatus Magasanikbacteria bacterium GW2011_GWC2_42_27]KKS71026.1 MAG: hypothetical protein UV42_C0037G0001 [Candidatus Magasanikbacteria bacterium GW2011_GWE2_42_7]KKT03811.1 MAG: hypothetical protein UV82_C0015G0002 [Candidatus Magasanikbacteria bacterium GW2011_GWD2_43_18]KKT25655.1 MAG: hypothetical protein UW10_C0005G0022 [Candidatus Magasanikbacteria bacterium GW2011_GWA2_43_9]HBB38476.1 hypothetical protein [Candidatus Magasanikbacteria bac